MWKALIILQLKKKVQKLFINDLMLFPYSVISLPYYKCKKQKMENQKLTSELLIVMKKNQTI